MATPDPDDDAAASAGGVEPGADLDQDAALEPGQGLESATLEPTAAYDVVAEFAAEDADGGGANDADDRHEDREYELSQQGIASGDLAADTELVADTELAADAELAADGDLAAHAEPAWEDQAWESQAWEDQAWEDQALERPAGESPAQDELIEQDDLADTGTEAPADDRPGGRRRLSAAGAVIGLLLGLLGFALVTQLKSSGSDQQLQAARPEDLVRILSDLDSRKDRLRLEINSLTQTEQQLTAVGRSQQAALDAAKARADQVGILAGTLAAQGPGLTITFTPGAKAIKASDVLNAVEELRGAGAEAMQIQGSNGATVRIVASTYFIDGPDSALVVDGQTLTGTDVITVIGDPQTMQTALNIPGGVVDTVHQDGGSVTVVSSQSVQVTALHQTSPPRYAQPAG